ncbi:hypothetical protein [Methylobacterium soli]|uniref:Uncharacterized protein n=1 Tax=Methylobacterium soli TaxID=553447 RepID=A0A6L3SUL6_9HYPH|nr:hypothetical protein [Methylobacterium soli]KAB1076524.1 hypothetical protein F6X53_22735 [Methylobacterium soli]
MDELIGLGIACENCGRLRRLNKRQIASLIGARGIHTVEQLGRKLKCKVCAEQGKVSKNISIVPYYRCDEAASVAPYVKPKASSQGVTR